MADYRLPSLGADMDDAVLVEWKVGPGDSVRKGQVVALIETSKSVMDIEFFEDAVIGEILVPAGETVAVGTPIARYEPSRDGQAAPAPEPSVEALLAPVTPSVAEAPPIEAPVRVGEPPLQVPPAVSAGRRRVHPPARRLADQLGVDLNTVEGSGPAGMVLRADVRAVAGQQASPDEDEHPGTAPVTSAEEAVADAGVSRPVRASPRARRLAEEHGVELATVTATGPDGTVSGDDVERLVAASAAELPPATPPTARPAREPEPSGAGPSEADKAAARRLAMRRAIADLMARSKREIPHYYLELQIDMTRSLDWLEAENAARPMAKRLLPAVLLIKAVARAALDVPEMNGFWIDDHFEPGEAVHTGIAISLREGGLIAPAIHDAGTKDLDELMASLRDLVTRTRAGVLHRAEMTEQTITVTNLGDQGVDAVHGVIYPPQVALVGFGRVSERPWASGSMVGARRAVTATLAADHRATDGHRGGIFLTAIDRWLQEPEKP